MSWPKAPFIEVCNIQGGTQPPKSTFVDSERDGYIRLLQIQDFKRSDKAVYVPDKKSLKKCKANDILIGRYGASVGKVLTGLSGAYNVALVKTLPDLERLDRAYLYHFLCSPVFQNYILNVGSRAAQAGFNKDDLAGLSIPLPPLKEQQRIAAILDKADAIRRKRKQAIALADEFLRAVFLDMFGDPVTNPKGWEVCEIGQVCSEIVDCVNRTAPVVDYVTPFKMIRTTNIRDYKIDLKNVRYVEEDVFDKWVRRLRPQKGDVIFTREAPAGEAGIIESDENVFLGQRTMHFRPGPSKLNSSFLLYELMSTRIKRQIVKLSSGSTVAHLSVPECKKFEIRIPPVSEQERFDGIRENVNKIFRNMGSFSDDDLVSALSSEAFSGRL